MFNVSNTENTQQKKRNTKTLKEKFDDTFKNYMNGKLDGETAAKRLNISKEYFLKYVDCKNRVKVSRGNIYQHVQEYLNGEVTARESAEKLDISMMTFFTYVRDFGGKRKGHITLSRKVFEPIYQDYMLGNLSIGEAAANLGVSVGTFRNYIKFERRAQNDKDAGLNEVMNKGVDNYGISLS